MQTYIVMGLLALAAGYAGYVFLRRLGFWGAAPGCGCGCEGCPSRPAREKGGLRPDKPQGVTNSGSCGACAAAGGAAGQTSRAAPLVEIKFERD